MNNFSQSIQYLILHRFSCRKYENRPIPANLRQELNTSLAELPTGPFGNKARFKLVAAAEEDSNDLRGLGTYGFIRNPAGFFLGAIKPGEKYLEDFGYLMEWIILHATDLGLGTCWLGGTFTQSSFARKISLHELEKMPAVVSVGLIEDVDRSRNTVVRRRISADRRKPWPELFFLGDFEKPINLPQGSVTHEGFDDNLREVKIPLEMVRQAPSASNKQPWRVVVKGEACHFYLQRTQGYGRGSFTYRVLRLADLQRVDMGIAMCHFELTAQELGLSGGWEVDEPGIQKPDELTEYVVSWKI